MFGIPTIRVGVRIAEVGFAFGVCVLVSVGICAVVAVVGLDGIGGRR